jgi:excinuclease ABC subunit C
MLKGQFSVVKNYWKSQMKDYVANLQFEKAQAIKEKLDAFEDYQGKSTVVNTRIRNVDVFSLEDDGQVAYVNYIRVVNGAIIYTNTVELTKNLNIDPKELLVFAIRDLRDKYNSNAPQVLVPFPVNLYDDDVEVIVPKIGDKRKLLELSEKNLKFYVLQKQRDIDQRKRRVGHAERILSTLKEDLQMEDIPLHIECFDNSNIQGKNPVASCVVFRNARPSKKEYRHYHIKTVKGPDDYASMGEVVYRRYNRLLEEEATLPQLIIIDGGKGQLNAAVNSLGKLGILEDLTVIGIAKRLEEIYFPGDPIPLHINKKSESLKLIQQARNEAHRFAINFHRQVRSKDFTQTELTGIPGIGQKTADSLLKHFGSVQKVREASDRELRGLIGRSKALKVAQYFERQSKQN